MAKSKDSKGNALSAGGLARDADGNHADLPTDLAHSINGELLDVLTLLVAAAHERNGTLVEESDELTNHDTRADALLYMAETKLRGVIRSMGPYA